MSKAKGSFEAGAALAMAQILIIAKKKKELLVLSPKTFQLCKILLRM